MHKTDFENFLKICPIEDSLEENIKKRMVGKLSSLGIPFLNGIPEEMLASLANSVTIDNIPSNHVVFSQGESGDRFYIIVHGSVKVDTTTTSVESGECSNESAGVESIFGTLGPGQYFGEMSLVNRNPNLRAATVTSTQKSILLSIDKESFVRIFGSNSNVAAEFEIRLLKKLVRLPHILAHTLGVSTFREFLEEEHAGENIDFIVAVKEYKAEWSEEDLDKRMQLAKHIFVTFCAEFADRQVNIPHQMKCEIDARLNDAPSDLFDAANKEITRLLDVDKFGRYKSSSFFESFLGRLGIS